MLTLNELVAKIQAIGDGHKMIKTTYQGNVFDFMSKTPDARYPAMLFDLDTANFEGQVLNVSMLFFFFDRVLAETTNELDVLNDQLLIASDIVAQLRYQLFDFLTDGNVPLVFFREETPDILAGVRASISFEIPFDADRCAVPTTFTY
jgi:hypothetical protein